MCSPEPENLDAFFTVFEGSSPEHACHARLLWSSMSLLPPLEARLVSADIRQRLPVSRPQRGCSDGHGRSAPLQPRTPEPPPPLPQRLEERRRYAAMAAQRRATVALLRSQRELRVRRERLSAAVQPKTKLGGEETSKPRDPADSSMDSELVKQLQ